VLIEPGVFEESIERKCRNWFGPSDFGHLVCDPFSLGEYLFTVQAAGQYPEGDRALDWDLTTTAPIYVIQ
jgi:hypothetical protein